MNNYIPQLFFETIQKQFAFLATKYGFEGPHSNFGTNDELYLYEVWFIGKNISIEFYLDWRDQTIDCCVAQLIDGDKPDGWFMNEQGDRIRSNLSTWIRDKGNKNLLFTKVTGLSFEEQIKIEIGDYKRMLQEYGHSILEDKPGIF